MLPSLSIIVAVQAVTSLVAARPAYFASIPRALLALDCTYPEKYNITGFSAWTSADGDDNKTTAKFTFNDPTTSITTDCYQNSTSPKVIPVPGLATRYACDNPLLEFIWVKTKGADNGTLTMIERACPEENANSSTQFEASGTVPIQLVCTKTAPGSTLGDGQLCYSMDQVLNGQYRSIQPRPTPPKEGGRKMLHLL